jgi:DNA-binding response OmpR family regulator
MPKLDYVLVVEDDEDLAEAELQALTSQGHSATVARHGFEALQMVDQRMPKVILLDMLMPHMDGWEFAKRFHARHGKAAPLLVVTAAEHADTRAREIDADDCLAKPFDVRELLDKVEALGCEQPGSSESVSR